MKRLFLAVTTLIALSLSVSGPAQAVEWGETMFTVSTGKSGNNGFSELHYKDGTTKEFAYGKYDKNTNLSGKDKSSITYTNAMEGHLYQPWANQYMDDDYKYVTSNTYYHSSYMRLKNPAGNSSNPLTGGKINVEFDVKNNGKGAVNQTVSTAIDFHWWEDPSTGTAWMVFTELAWSVGTITDANGAEYELYIELKDQNTAEESAYIKLAGGIYDKVLDGIGLDGKPNLFAFAIPDGKEMWMAFKMGAYGSAVNPHATPVPGAVWLMGTGLAGIIAIRRRNAK